MMKGEEEGGGGGGVGGGSYIFRVVLSVSGVAKPSPRLALLLTHKECNASFCWMSSNAAAAFVEY